MAWVLWGSASVLTHVPPSWGPVSAAAAFLPCPDLCTCPSLPVPPGSPQALSSSGLNRPLSLGPQPASPHCVLGCPLRPAALVAFSASLQGAVFFHTSIS